MRTASISSDLAAQAIPFLDCFVATLLAMTERELLAMTPHLSLRVPINRDEAILGWGTWRKIELTPFSRKPEVAFAYYLAQFSS